MKRLKKLIAFVVTFALVFGAMAVGFAASPFTDVKSDAPYASAVDRLYALGITQGMGDGTYGPDLPLTRAQMVTFVIRMLGLEQVAQAAASEPPAFTDIKDHWAVGYINVAKDLKITDGVGDGKFAPDANLTYGQALAFAIRALGYTDVKWGTPTLAKAVELGLTAGINLGFNDVINRGETALVLNKALETEIFRGYNAEGAPIFGSKLIAKVAYTTKYLVVATPNVDSNVTAGKVLVKPIDKVNDDGSIKFKDAITINAGNLDFDKYLGKVVEVYTAKSSGVPVFVDVTDTPEKSFTAKSFEVTTSNNVYTVKNDGKEVVKIDNPADVTVVYNGGKTTLDKVFDTGKNLVYNGAKVVFTDTNNDGKYDYAVITDAYKSPVVVTADVKEGDKFLNVNGVYSSAYRIAGGDVKTVIVNGSVNKLTDIKKGDVVYYGSTVDGTKIILLVVRDKVEGKVTKLVVGDKRVATINDKDYVTKVALSVGDEGTFILDKDGNIVYFIGKEAVANYAVAIAIKPATKGFDDGKVKLLTADGKVTTYASTVTDATYQYSETEKVIVTYTIKDNVVKEIKPATGDRRVISVSGVTGTYEPSTRVLTIGSDKYYLMDSTVVFNVYDDDYSVVKVSDINMENLKVNYIVADRYGYVKALLLNNKDLTAPEKETSIYGYIAKVVDIVTTDGTKYQLTVWANGTETTYTTKLDIPRPSTGVATLLLDKNNVVFSITPVTESESITAAVVRTYTAAGITTDKGSFALSPNVTVVKTVYKSDGTVDHYELAQLGDLAAGYTVNMYKDSTGKIAVIVITKTN